jgi:hypothetical protein
MQNRMMAKHPDADADGPRNKLDFGAGNGPFFILTKPRGLNEMSTKIEGEIIEIPMKIARKINNRCVDAMRINAEHANTLHERGEEFAISNACDTAIKAYLLHIMEQDFTPTESIECFMTLLAQIILPSFGDIPHVREQILKTERPNKDSTVLAEINQMLRDNDMEPVMVGGTLEEIIDQLRGMLEAESQTKQ